MPRIPRPYDSPDPTLQPARGVAQIDERVAGRIGSAGNALGNAVAAIGNAFADVANRTSDVQDSTNAARAKLDWYKFDNEAWKGIEQNASEDGTGWETAGSVYDTGRKEIQSKYPVSDPKRRADLDLFFERQVAERGFAAARAQQQQAGKYFRGIEDQEIAGAAARVEANPTQATVDSLRGPLGELIEGGRGKYHSEATIQMRQRQIEGALMMGQYRGLLKVDPEAADELMGKIRAGKYEIDRTPVQPQQPGPQSQGGPLNIQPSPVKFRDDWGFQRTDKIRGMVMHYTEGSDNIQGNVAWGNEKGTGANYYIAKDGTVYEAAQDSRGTRHMLDAKNFDKAARKDFSSGNTLSVEIMVRPGEKPNAAQVQAAEALARSKAEQYGFDPGKDVYGHGELNPGHRHSTEGMSVVSRLRGSGQSEPQLVQQPQLVARGATEPAQQGESVAAPPGTVIETGVPGNQQSIPVSQRGITQGMSKLAQAPEVVQGIDAMQTALAENPNAEVRSVVPQETLAALAEQFPDLQLPEMMTVAEAAKAVEQATGQSLTKKADFIPMGRLEGGQVFTVNSRKFGEIKIPAESINALDKSMLRKMHAEAKELTRIRQREGEAIGDDMIRKELLTQETQGKSHTEFNRATLAEIYRRNPKKLAEFDRKLSIAKSMHEATADAGNIPTDMLEERLDRMKQSITNEYGDADPVAQAAVDRAEKRVKGIIALRDRDPARSVRDSTEVRAVIDQLPGGEPKNKAHLYQLADATMKAQVRLGLPQVPITKTEANTIMKDLIFAPEKDKRRVAEDVAKRVADNYGNLADRVLAAAMKLTSGDTRDDDDILSSSLRRVRRGASSAADVDKAASGAAPKGDRAAPRPNFFDPYE